MGFEQELPGGSPHPGQFKERKPEHEDEDEDFEWGGNMVSSAGFGSLLIKRHGWHTSAEGGDPGASRGS
jgi:hypothetical protein